MIIVFHVKNRKKNLDLFDVMVTDSMFFNAKTDIATVLMETLALKLNKNLSPILS